MYKNKAPAKKKCYGQNFIYDSNLINELLDCVNINSEDKVLEIGSGLGTLSSALALKCNELISIEIDNDLMPYLKLLETKHKNLHFINADFMQLDLLDLCKDWLVFKVIANIPYYITSDILHKLIFDDLNINQICCMVQLEVAHKIVAKANDNNYGVLSLICQNGFNIHIAKRVKAECFDPKPKVDSAFIVMNKKPYEIDKHIFYKFVKAAFMHRRKTLVNSLKASGYNETKVLQALNTINKKENSRAQELEYIDFVNLIRALNLI